MESPYFKLSVMLYDKHVLEKQRQNLLVGYKKSLQEKRPAEEIKAQIDQINENLRELDKQIACYKTSNGIIKY